MTSASQLLTGGSLGSVEQEVANNSHIYLLCKSPVISFSKDSFEYKNGIISGHINYRVEGEIRKKEFSFKFPLLDGAVELRLSDYPHRKLITLDSEGNEVRHLPASRVCMSTRWHLQNNELRDLEVLYVGQAYGDGTRSAFERLKSHSTLQKIIGGSSI